MEAENPMILDSVWPEEKDYEAEDELWYQRADLKYDSRWDA